MLFNLVSGLSGVPEPEDLCSYNHVVAYCLRRALAAEGHEVRLITEKDSPPAADHTIVISNAAINKVRGSPEYRLWLRSATSGKVCLWLDSDFGDWRGLFDRVLVVNRKRARLPELFRYVGWAADPEIFFPEQTDLAVYVDAYLDGLYPQYAPVYAEIKQVLASMGLRVLQLVPEYSYRKRVGWLTLAGAFRKCSFFIVTGLGYWGLTNIEAATCGALLVVHQKFDDPLSWPSRLNHVVYSSAEELRQILCRRVEVQVNRRVALENSWEKVAGRVLEAVA